MSSAIASEISRQSVAEVSAMQSDPGWLLQLRLQAFEIYGRMAFPDPLDDEWRRTDISQLLPLLDSLRPYEDGDATTVAQESIVSQVCGRLVQSGSMPGRAQLDAELAAKGVVMAPMGLAASEHPELVRAHLFSQVTPDRDKFAALHAALFSGGTFVYVPDGVSIERPLLSRFGSTGSGAVVSPHTLIIAGRSSRFTYIDEFQSANSPTASLNGGSAELFLGDGAEVDYVALQDWGRQAWQFATQRVLLNQDAKVNLVTLALGGRFTKMRTEAILAGPGSSAELKGLLLGSGDQFFDHHTLQDHRSPHTTSDLLFKGALRDRSRSMYAGLIRVAPGAQRADAYQANRNLLLSSTSKADSIPMLEIESNDVRCTHGATVGPVDLDQLFYLQSRGLPLSVAQQMIVQGFFREVLGRIPLVEVVDRLEQEIAARAAA